MSIQVEDYFARETFSENEGRSPTSKETPFVVIDTAMISQAYDDLRARFSNSPRSTTRFKANPGRRDHRPAQRERFELRHRLDLRARQSDEPGASARIASATATPSRSPRTSATSTRRGVRPVRHRLRSRPAQTSPRAAPGSKVYVRILTEGSTTADWPFVAQNSAARPTWPWTC